MSGLEASQRVYDFDEFLSGLWEWRLLHRQSPEKPLKIRIRWFAVAATVSCVQVALLFVQILRYMCLKPIDWDNMVEATAVLCPAMIAACQGASHLFNRRPLERLMANLEKLFPRTKCEQRDMNFEQYAKKLFRHRSFVDKLGRCTCVIFNSMPLLFCLYESLILGKDFPFRTQFKSWYPVNTRSWVVYPFVFAFELATSISFGFYLTNDYVFYAVATTQMQMHYRSLGKMLSQLDPADGFLKLARLVDYHCALDKLRDDVNEIFNVTTFISFSITKFSTCFIIYALLHGTSLIILPTLMTLFIFLVLSTFMRCSNASDVYTTSVELVNRIYESNWYEASPRYRRMLMYMMARANNPAVLYALKVTKVRMETFKEVVLEAYQIFMFLLNFADK